MEYQNLPYFTDLFFLPSLLHHVLSEPELGNSMSTIQELCKRLLSRRPNLEPILSKQLLQLGTNLVVETSGSISNDSSVMSTVIAKLRKIAVLMLHRSPTAKTAGKQKIR